MSTLPVKPRKLRKTPQFESSFGNLTRGLPRAAEAMHYLERVLLHSDNAVAQGMSIPGRAGFFGRPLHLDESNSFLVIYRVTSSEVILVDVRKVPAPSNHLCR